MGFLRDLLGGASSSQRSSPARVSKKATPQERKEESRSDSTDSEVADRDFSSRDLATFATGSLEDRISLAREKYELALSFFDAAQQAKGVSVEQSEILEKSAVQALVGAIIFNPKFLKAHLLLARFYFAKDPVKNARPIVENLMTARIIDLDDRQTMLFLADVLEISECRNHFLRITSFDPDEVDDHIQALRDDTI